MGILLDGGMSFRGREPMLVEETVEADIGEGEELVVLGTGEMPRLDEGGKIILEKVSSGRGVGVVREEDESCGDNASCPVRVVGASFITGVVRLRWDRGIGRTDEEES